MKTSILLPVAFVFVFGLCGFVEAGNKFRIDFPNGWSAPVVAEKDGTVQSDAPPSASRAWCRANSVALASLDGMSQKQINSEFAEPLSRETWAGVLTVDASKFEISDASVRKVDGRLVHEVTISFAGDPFLEPTRLRFLSWILPHRMVNAGCFAPAANYKGWAPEFERTVNSLRPL
jgi:hypothetical protein